MPPSCPLTVSRSSPSGEPFLLRIYMVRIQRWSGRSALGRDAVGVVPYRGNKTHPQLGARSNFIRKIADFSKFQLIYSYIMTKISYNLALTKAYKICYNRQRQASLIRKKEDIQ